MLLQIFNGKSYVCYSQEFLPEYLKEEFKEQQSDLKEGLRSFILKLHTHRNHSVFI